MFGSVSGSQLASSLSPLFSAADGSRSMTILKQQCRQLLREQLRGFCAQELFAQSRVWRALNYHTDSALEELRAGQTRCALELGLFLWELTRTLAGACLRPQPSFPALLERQRELLSSIEPEIGGEQLSAWLETQRTVPPAEPMSMYAPEMRLLAGDDALLSKVSSSAHGPVLVLEGQSRRLSADQAPTPWAYARVLLLAGQQETLYAFLLEQPQLLPDFEDYFPRFSPDQALTLRLEELRKLTRTATKTTEYAHIFNVLVGWLNGAERDMAAELLPELVSLTRRAGLKKMLGSLQAYEKTLDRGHAQTATL